MENNQQNYFDRFKTVILELKQLKQFQGINGDMDLSDEIRKINDLLTDLLYNWGISTEVILKAVGYYILHSEDSIEQKEKDWNIISNFLRALGQLRTHSDYIQTNQIFFEGLVAAIDREEIIV